MRTSSWVGIMSVALLACATVSSAPANAQGSPVSKQKNYELDNVSLNQGNYDSPPVTPPSKFSIAGYDECLVALGTTYCRQQHGPWSALN